MLCRICIVHIQPKKHVLDHADPSTPTRQHELDHIQIRNISAQKYLDHGVAIDDLFNVWRVHTGPCAKFTRRAGNMQGKTNLSQTAECRYFYSST